MYLVDPLRYVWRAIDFEEPERQIGQEYSLAIAVNVRDLSLCPNTDIKGNTFALVEISKMVKVSSNITKDIALLQL